MEQPANTTPGPWWSTEDGLVMVCQSGWLVTRAFAGGPDAKLISAAPELYDALMRLVDRIEAADQQYDPDEWEAPPSLYDSPEHLEAIAALRRAGWTR